MERMGWGQMLLLIVTWSTEGFNIYEKPVTTFQEGHDDLFGQTGVQSKDGVLVPSPNSGAVFMCSLNKIDGKDKCRKHSDIGGSEPIVSVANLLTNRGEDSMTCQQQRKIQRSIEHLNAACTLQSAEGGARGLTPAAMVIDLPKKRQRRSDRNNNNNNNNDEDDEEGPGTEIGFVLDGSTSINNSDFAIAKAFISDVMSNVWKKCYNCDFTIVQYGSTIRTELSLTESKGNGPDALEKVKKIKQIGNATETASAIQYLLNYSFAYVNGSNPAAKKMMIVLSDGAISYWDRVNLPLALDMLEQMKVTRFAIGVGDIINNNVAKKEMADIAGKKENLRFVDNYNALTGILSQLEHNLLSGIEGLNEGDGFRFELSQAGFSSHIAPDRSLLFGAVGANDWSGGIIVSQPPDYSAGSFLEAESPEYRFSYLGYSVLSVKAPSGLLYVSGAPRYNLTGGVFVFDGANQKQRQLLRGEQFGSYFGSVLCAVDIDGDGVTDFLLVGAPFHHRKAEEGKVFIYKVLGTGKLQREDFEWRGLDKYRFSRFGSAVASVGDLDGNGCGDVVVGAPLEEDGLSGRSGSIYIFNGKGNRLQPQHSQRVSAAAFETTLRHFGQWVSAFSEQEGRRRQPYISVGSEGSITILETLPVIDIEPTLNLMPTIIPFSWRETKKKDVILTIEFKSKETDTEEFIVLYHINVDVGQDNKRLTFSNSADKEGVFSWTASKKGPAPIRLVFRGCLDCGAPIAVSLNFTLNVSADPKPRGMLDYWTAMEVTKKMTFRNGCKGACVENISLSDSKLNHDVVIIGSTKSQSISFVLINRGDEVYMSTLVVQYPDVLQYSHTTGDSISAGIKCANEEKKTFSEVKCRLLQPHFKKAAQANFVIHWQIVDNKAETHNASIKARLTSETQEGLQTVDEKIYTFGIKNALKLQLAGTASPKALTLEKGENRDIVFTFKFLGENKYNATLTVDIKLRTTVRYKEMKVSSVEPKDHCELIQPEREYTIKCRLTVFEDLTIKAHLSDIDVEGSSSYVAALASVDFEEHFRLVGSNTTSSEVRVPVLEQKVIKSMAAIIGGSVGGLFFLVLLVVILIKCGFYKKRVQCT